MFFSFSAVLVRFWRSHQFCVKQGLRSVMWLGPSESTSLPATQPERGGFHTYMIFMAAPSQSPKPCTCLWAFSTDAEKEKLDNDSASRNLMDKRSDIFAPHFCRTRDRASLVCCAKQSGWATLVRCLQETTLNLNELDTLAQVI